MEKIKPFVLQEKTNVQLIFLNLHLKNLYKIKDLIFISIEYEDLIDINKFKTKELFNFHFSLLPKFRGCHTNFFQIYYGEKKSGVTLHKIDNGIDTGPILSNIEYKISVNDNAFKNYKRLMKTSFLLYKKNFVKIIKKKYKERNQNDKKSTYFSRNSIDYKEMKFFKVKKMNREIFNKLKAFIFPPFQLPVVNQRLIKNVKFIKKKYIFIYD